MNLLLQIICIIVTLTPLSQQQEQISRGECNGSCSNITDCPPLRKNFSAMFNANRIKFCNLATSTVCCPGKVIDNTIDIRTVDPTTLSFNERECIAYNKRVYPKCGPQEFIVNGTDAEPAEFPHMALLGALQEDGVTVNWMCGGSLISPKFVLSAAHCFYDDPIPDRVRLGELDYSTDTDRTQTQDFMIEHYTPHPEYDYNKNYNDIVLIELNREAQLNQFVVPACLPSGNGTEHTHFKAAGWGVTKTAGQTSPHLKKVTLERFDDKECKEKINSPLHLDQGIHIRTQLCAGSRLDNRDTCQGDSGGPLFVQHPSLRCMFQIVGITSFSQGACGIAGIPGVYVRVNVYESWIESIVWKVGAK